MDEHSTNLRLWALVGVCICILQPSALAERYCSFGRTFNKSFGDLNEKILLTEDIFIPVEGRILDIDLALNIEHTNIGDLQIKLKSPAGTVAYLYNYDWSKHIIGQTIPDFYWTIFDDESPISIDSAQSPHCGLYRPNGPDSLSDFYGQQSDGMWQVSVHDMVFDHTGIFKGIRLDFHLDTEPSGGLLSANVVPEPAAGLLFALSTLITALRGRTRPV